MVTSLCIFIDGLPYATQILISVYEGLVFAADLAILITNFTLLGVKPKTNTNACVYG